MADKDQIASEVQGMIDRGDRTANPYSGLTANKKKMLRRLSYYIGMKKHQTPEKEYPVLNNG